MEHAREAAFESSEALRNDIISEAEALYRQTGLTPARLQARVAELEGALREYQGHAHHSDAGNTLSAMRHFEKFESELARLLP